MIADFPFVITALPTFDSFIYLPADEKPLLILLLAEDAFSLIPPHTLLKKPPFATGGALAVFLAGDLAVFLAGGLVVVLVILELLFKTCLVAAGLVLDLSISVSSSIRLFIPIPDAANDNKRIHLFLGLIFGLVLLLPLGFVLDLPGLSFFPSLPVFLLLNNPAPAPPAPANPSKLNRSKPPPVLVPVSISDAPGEPPIPFNCFTCLDNDSSIDNDSISASSSKFLTMTSVGFSRSLIPFPAASLSAFMFAVDVPIVAGSAILVSAGFSRALARSPSLLSGAVSGFNMFITFPRGVPFSRCSANALVNQSFKLCDSVVTSLFSKSVLAIC